MDLGGESDIEQLRLIAQTQQRQIVLLIKELERVSAENDELQGRDGRLQQALAVMNAQLEETSARIPTPSDEAKAPTKPTQGHGPTPQPKLEVVEELFELDEPDRTCPSCGGQLQPLEGQFESSEMIDVVEVSYRVVQVKRQKYSCQCGGCIETALGPERAIDGGRYSLAFAIKVAIDKYVDHLPLTRQARIMKRWGLETTSQALWDQLHAASHLLRPCYDALYARVLSGPVFGLDQTSWKRLHQRGATPWQMWCLTTDDVVYHRIREDKSVDSWNALVGNFQGVVVCDALSTHGARGRNRPGPTLAGCWAHVVRRFREAQDDFPQARVARERIRQLYDIEEKARSLEHRRRLRRDESKPVLELLERWLHEQAVLPSSSLGSAIRYTLGHWSRLTVFADNPHVPLDNNRTERGIRGPVVGRKNHYGSKSKRGTEVAAIFYTLIETAKLTGVEPRRYLTQAAHAARLGTILLPHQLAANA